MWLLAGTVPAFKKLLAGTVPAFKRLLAGTHKFYFFGFFNTFYQKKKFTLKKIYGYLPLKGYWQVPIIFFWLLNTFYQKNKISHFVTFLTWHLGYFYFFGRNLSFSDPLCQATINNLKTTLQVTDGRGGGYQFPSGLPQPHSWVFEERYLPLIISRQVRYLSVTTCRWRYLP